MSQTGVTMRRLIALAVLFTGFVVLPGERVSACSCAPVHPRAGLKSADGAVVGSLISRGEPKGEGGVLSGGESVNWTFDVEVAVKGDIGETVDVVSAWSGVSCGLGVHVGERVGVLLTLGDRGRWRSGLCYTLDANDLLAAAGPLPGSIPSPVPDINRPRESITREAAVERAAGPPSSSDPEERPATSWWAVPLFAAGVVGIAVWTRRRTSTGRRDPTG